MRNGLAMTVAAVCFSAAFAASASAQNMRSFVATSGNDSNTCIISAPCATFQRAHDQTVVGGDVYALDPVVNTTPLVMTKGMSFFAVTGDTGLWPAFAVASGSAVTINVPASHTVTFVNFAFDGLGTADNGILFNTGSELMVYGGLMRRFRAAAPNGFGIRFLPTAVSKLLVQEARFVDNGAATTGGGVQVSPQGAGGGAQVLLTRVSSQANAFGLAIDTTASSNGVNALIRGGEFHFNRQDGIIAVGGAPIGVIAKDTASFANSGNGVRAIGSNVAIRLYSANVSGNGMGVASVGGGIVASYGNNTIDANATNGTPTVIPQK